MEEEKNIKSDKHQTELLVGFALLILGVIFACFALMQPKVSKENNSVNTEVNSSQYYEDSSENQYGNSINETSVKSNNSNKKVNKKSKGANNDISVTYPLNLNTCTSEELQTIDNIGKTRADAIIAYRNHLGGYTSVEQLKDISGIGDSVFSSIEPYVMV